MNGLRLSQADTKKPDMKGWSDYRKADYEKTQRLLKMRWSKYNRNESITQNERKMIKVSTNNNKNGLAYSSKDINRNFRIKVSGVDAQGRKVHKLVGVTGAIALIGVEMLNKLLKRAFACMDDVCVCKLRRGIKFSFYYK